MGTRPKLLSDNTGCTSHPTAVGSPPPQPHKTHPIHARPMYKRPSKVRNGPVTTVTTTPTPTPSILLIGGGHVGLCTALRLQQRLRPGEAELTLVDPKSYMT